jgi:hypothetical protein
MNIAFLVTNAEIEAAAEALRALWDSNDNREAIRRSGHGASWRHQAIVALAAAAASRGVRAVSE